MKLDRTNRIKIGLLTADFVLITKLFVIQIVDD